MPKTGPPIITTRKKISKSRPRKSLAYGPYSNNTVVDRINHNITIIIIKHPSIYNCHPSFYKLFDSER